MPALSIGKRVLALMSFAQTARAFTVYNGSPHPRWANYIGFYYFDSSFTHQGTGWQNAFDSAASEWQTNAWLGWNPYNCKFATAGQTCWPVRGVDHGKLNPLGLTTIDWDSNHHFNSWVTTMNSYVSWYTGTGSVPVNQYDFSTVAKHELGHGVGLCHTGTSNRLMNANVSRGTRLYVGSDATNGNYYLYENGYSGPGPESSSCLDSSDTGT